MKASPKRLQATLQSSVGLAVYSYPKVLPELMVDLSIHFTYILVLDDSISDDPDATMKFWYRDLLQGYHQEHPWWRSVNGHFPILIGHFGPFCAMSIVRSAMDCKSHPSNHIYRPRHKLRLNSLPRLLDRAIQRPRQVAAASLFPNALFDEKELFSEITAAIAQLENWVA